MCRNRFHLHALGPAGFYSFSTRRRGPQAATQRHAQPRTNGNSSREASSVDTAVRAALDVAPALTIRSGPQECYLSISQLIWAKDFTQRYTKICNRAGHPGKRQHGGRAGVAPGHVRGNSAQLGSGGGSVVPLGISSGCFIFSRAAAHVHRLYAVSKTRRALVNAAPARRRGRRC